MPCVAPRRPRRTLRTADGVPRPQGRRPLPRQDRDLGRRQRAARAHRARLGRRTTSSTTRSASRYIDLAFRSAHAADPRARLFLNELVWNPALGDPKAGALLALVERLKRRHVPIDGVGIQVHGMIGLAPPWFPESTATLTRYLRALASARRRRRGHRARRGPPPARPGRRSARRSGQGLRQGRARLRPGAALHRPHRLGPARPRLLARHRPDRPAAAPPTARCCSTARAAASPPTGPSSRRSANAGASSRGPRACTRSPARRARSRPA